MRPCPAAVPGTVSAHPHRVPLKSSQMLSKFIKSKFLCPLRLAFPLFSKCLLQLSSSDFHNTILVCPPASTGVWCRGFPLLDDLLIPSTGMGTLPQKHTAPILQLQSVELTVRGLKVGRWRVIWCQELGTDIRIEIQVPLYPFLAG